MAFWQCHFGVEHHSASNREDWAVDETGNRRYLPVKTQNIDVAGLKRDRDRIWAAAYSEYMRTKHWWLQDQFIDYVKGQTGSLVINRRQGTFVQKSDVNGEWLVLRGTSEEIFC